LIRSGEYECWKARWLALVVSAADGARGGERRAKEDEMTATSIGDLSTQRC
jgi:hypothetical protein